jgi:hypothetical protein
VAEAEVTKVEAYCWCWRLLWPLARLVLTTGSRIRTCKADAERSQKEFYSLCYTHSPLSWEELEARRWREGALGKHLYCVVFRRKIE